VFQATLVIMHGRCYMQSNLRASAQVSSLLNPILHNRPSSSSDRMTTGACSRMSCCTSSLYVLHRKLNDSSVTSKRPHSLRHCTNILDGPPASSLIPSNQQSWNIYIEQSCICIHVTGQGFANFRPDPGPLCFLPLAETRSHVSCVLSLAMLE
jgi:hypothetical protein